MIPGEAQAESFWVATAPDLSFPVHSGELEVDVAIVGGGIVGLTTATLLTQAGRKVAVLEARRIGRQATGRSTAKLTSQHSLIYRKLAKSHGRGGARSYAQANQAAVERVADLVAEIGIDCGFTRKPAYVFARTPEEARNLEEEAEFARSLGLPADIVHAVPLPFPVECALRFTGQAQLQPCGYVGALARWVAAAGGHVREHSRMLEIETGQPHRVVTERGAVSARDIVIATQLPIGSPGMFFAKAYPHCQPIVAARIDPARRPDGMFISAGPPILSVLAAEAGDATWLVAAGDHCRPGQSRELRQALTRLEQSLRDQFGIGDIAYRWTNEDYQAMDGVPFVGRPSASDPHLYVATGFHGWGLSNGTAAAMIIADLIGDRANPWAALFDASRINALASAQTFLSENAGTAMELLGGHLARRPKSAAELLPGEAEVVDERGHRVAAHRDAAGVLHRVSAICTHMKCVVGWNPVSRTWDCPCHGSRFEPDGTVIQGPAVAPLAPAPRPDD